MSVFAKVSVLVPTRKRLARLTTMMSSYDATSEGSTSELVFRVDDDDAETQRFLDGKLVVVGPRLGGYRSMAQYFNDMLALASGDVLMLGNDDMVFRTPGWAALILAEANRFPDGLFDLGVATFNESHYPFSCVSRRAVEVMGHLWDPRLAWGDIFLRDVMGRFGRSILLPHVRIDHDWIGHAPDAVFLEGNQTELHQVPGYWTDVHAPVVDEMVEKLRGALWG